MKSILTRNISVLLIIAFLFSCNNTKVEKDDKISLLKKIEQLKEFKKAEKRIDSLKKTGINTEISISLVNDSFFFEDSLKNISLAFVNEDLGFANNTLFIVKYDSKTYKIISVEPNK